MSLAALGGACFAAGTLIGLEISEFTTLFGFHEHGYRPALALSVAFEAATIITLAVFVILELRAHAPDRRPARHRATTRSEVS